MKALDWAYQKALDGLPGFDSSVALAEKYLAGEGTVPVKASRLIRRQKTLAATSGFITGLGGFMTLPVVIPVNLASVLWIQVRMIAAVAHMGGYDLRDDKVKTMVLLCLAGNMAKDIVQEAGIVAGTRLTARLIAGIPEHALVQINERLGFKLISILGGKGIVDVGKAVPLASGLIGGAIDLAATTLVGKAARKAFLSE
jgi:hypothetical protein